MVNVLLELNTHLYVCMYRAGAPTSDPAALRQLPAFRVLGGDTFEQLYPQVHIQNPA